MPVGPHEDAPRHVNDEDCREVDEQKKSGFDLFYLGGVYAIVKIAREYKMGDQSGRPLCCVRDAKKQGRKRHNCVSVQPSAFSYQLRWWT